MAVGSRWPSALRTGTVAGPQYLSPARQALSGNRRGRLAHGTSPRRRAIAAASVRVLAESLATMFETWTLAVLALTNSASPISRSLRPVLSGVA